MKIIIAMDSFKGSMTSVEATEVVKKSCKKIIPEASVISFPIADGGEGTIEVIKKLAGGKYKEIYVSDPLERKIKKLIKNRAGAVETKTLLEEQNLPEAQHKLKKAVSMPCVIV